MAYAPVRQLKVDISALYKGGGPLRLRNGGGLAFLRECVSIQRNLRLQVPSTGC
jgi:hypothetical protein